MSGRNKNRVKNNARPSNSGRSAEFLEDSVKNFGFQSFKDIGIVSPAFSIQRNDIFASDIDQNIQLLFKKMLKKDPTTKIKALQEFSEAIKKTEPDDVKLILPYWSKIFYGLATDLDNKVREACHLAHHEVVSKVKRDLAPFLKQIIAPWFTSIYDTYPPAATAASRAFYTAFPENKIGDVAAFCSEEILSYVDSNLFRRSGSGDQKLSDDDKEARLERIVASSLSGLALFANKIPENKIENSEESIRKIASNKQFWSYAEHGMVRVRAAWYETLTALIQKRCSFFEGRERQLLSATLGRLDENDPVVLPWVWQNILLTITTIKDWWTFIKFEDIKKRMWKFLRDGGKGNASILFPNLLPFISQLSFLENKADFYDNFFLNLSSGLTKITPDGSKTEAKAVSTALIECLKFVVIQMKDDPTFCEKIIESNLTIFLKWNFMQPQFTTKIVYTQLTSLVRYWSRNEDDKLYANLFWEFLSNSFQEEFERLSVAEKVDVINFAEKQVEFLSILKNLPDRKGKCKVTFSDQENRVSESVEESNFSSNEYNSALNDLALRTAIDLWKIIENRKFEGVVKCLRILLGEFCNESIALKFEQILDKILHRWLESDELKCESLVGIVFILYEYLPDEGKRSVVRSFETVNDVTCLTWIARNALIDPYNGDPAIKNWLVGEKVSKLFVDLVLGENLNVSSSEILTIFKLATPEGRSRDTLIGTKTISNVMEVLNDVLSSPEKSTNLLDKSTRIASYLCSVLYTPDRCSDFDKKLPVTLLKLTWNSPEDISDDINESCFDSFAVLFENLSLEEINDLLEVVVGLITEALKTRSDSSISKISDGLSRIVQASYRYKENILSALFDHSFCRTWRSRITDLCQYNDYLSGKLHFNPGGNVRLVSYEEENVLVYFLWCYIKSNVLCNSGTALENSKKLEWLASILYDIELYKSFSESFKTYKYHEELISYYKNVELKASQVCKEKIEDYLEDWKKMLTIKFNEESSFWLNVTLNVLLDISQEPAVTTFEDLIPNISDDKLKLHLIKLTGKHLSFDNVKNYTDINEQLVISRAFAYSGDYDSRIIDIMNGLKEFKKDGSGLGQCLNEDKLRFYCESLLCCKSFIVNKFSLLSREHLDLVLVYLSDTLADLSSKPIDEKSYPLINASLDLYSTVVRKVKELKINDKGVAFTTAWDDLFAESLQSYVLSLWLNATEPYELEDEGCLNRFALLLNLDLDCIEPETVKPMEPSRFHRLLNRSLKLITKKNPALQLLGYKTLEVLIPASVGVDSRAVSTNTHELVFGRLIDLLESTGNVVDTMLLDFKLIDDTCTVEPFTDSFAYTLAYLLLWDIILLMCTKSSTELKYQYADLLKEKGLLNKLCNNVFRLMPSEVLRFSKGRKMYIEYFTSRPTLKMNAKCSSLVIEYQACWIYSSALSQLPAMVRQWWSSTEPKVSHVVENLTSFYISPHLCREELDEISAQEKAFKNMTIKVMPGVRDILATYTVDEAKMELVITLPKNYPLSGPQVQCNSQIEHNSQKSWLLQFKKCVLHQNGKIWDGIFSWNKNLDKKFDGVEECYICFGVLHAGTYQLPKLCCRTCKKKFHSACLYKWFSTSNKSSCPICRNMF